MPSSLREHLLDDGQRSLVHDELVGVENVIDIDELGGGGGDAGDVPGGLDHVLIDLGGDQNGLASLDAVKCDGKALVVTPAVDTVIVKSARNIPGVETTPANNLNVYDILNAKQLIVDKAALAVIEEVFA